MKTIRLLILALIVASTLRVELRAQTNAPGARVEHSNSAVIPVSRDGRALPRQNEVLQRAKDNPGPCDVVFIGDSITQGWEGNPPNGGKNVWEKYYGGGQGLKIWWGGV